MAAGTNTTSDTFPSRFQYPKQPGKPPGKSPKGATPKARPDKPSKKK